MDTTAFLFDYNGVLVDDELVHWAAFHEVLAPLGVEMSQADYWERYLGYDDLGAFRAVLTDHGRPGSDAEIRTLVAQKKPAYLRLAQTRLRGFPGAGELLRELAARGTPVGIVSGALRDEIEMGLEYLNAKDCVRFIVSAEDTQENKPNPECYLLGIAKLAELVGDETAKAAWVIEDSLSGIEAAKAANLRCLAVTHSYDEMQLRAAGADKVVPRIADITPAFLNDLQARVRS
jgi:HAD superfamily hydrolase (TIGR01509 family)